MATPPAARRLLAPAILVVVAMVGLGLVLTRDDAPVTADAGDPGPAVADAVSPSPGGTADAAAERRPSAAAMAPLRYEDPAHPLTIGDADAPLVMVEFTSFGCLWCGNFHRLVMPDVVDEWVDSGRLRIETRAMPYVDAANPGAKMLVAAAEQDRYWELAEEVYPWISGGLVPDGPLQGEELAAYQERMGEDALFAMVAGVADELDVDMDRLRADYDDPATQEVVNRDTRLATDLGFTGTPAMLINMVPVGGYVPAERFDQLLDEILELTEEPVGTTTEPAGAADE